MKIVIVTLSLAAAVLAAPQYQQQYQQQQYQQQSQQAQRPIAILKLNSDVGPDGSFIYEYETENKIQAQARGTIKNPGTENESLSVQGSYSFVGDDGQTYTVTYIADENGFQPQGAHLPTPPPIPEAIQRSLDFNARNPEDGQQQQRPRQQQVYGR